MAQTSVRSKKQATVRKKAQRTRSKAGRRIATEPTAAEVAGRKAVARALFNPLSAGAARASFLKRQPTTPDHAE